MAKILAVEDEPLVRFLIVETLESEGFTVLAAPDGEAALSLVHDTADIDLIVTDVRMPKMDGFQLAQAARRARPTLGLLFITGYLGTEIPTEFASAKILHKPFDPDRLTAAVRELLAKTPS